MNRKQLYESIMRNVSREVKKVLNENTDHPIFNKYTPEEIKNIAARYLRAYYRELPEERGEYPNWGELDSFNMRHPQLF